MNLDNNKLIVRAITIGLIVNIILALLKLITGIIGHSEALTSDGLNSSSDVFISIMLLVIMRIATKKPDHNHPYGHEKFEGIGYFTLGFIFFFTSLFIGFTSVKSIIDYIGNQNVAVAPALVTLIVSIISLLIKFFLFRFYMSISNKTNSPAIKADAKNHFIDAWATLFSVIGIGLSQLNLIVFDYIASLIIGLFILRLALQILKEAVTYLVDQAPSDAKVDAIQTVILGVSGVISVDDLKVRKHMVQKYVDVEIGVDAKLSLERAHQIAEHVHHEVEKQFPEVIHCMVHVNPYPKK